MTVQIGYGGSSVQMPPSTEGRGENAAAGFGITREMGDQLLEGGVDSLTSGNHIWDKKEAIDYIGAHAKA